MNPADNPRDCDEPSIPNRIDPVVVLDNVIRLDEGAAMVPAELRRDATIRLRDRLVECQRSFRGALIVQLHFLAILDDQREIGRLLQDSNIRRRVFL